MARLDIPEGDGLEAHRMWMLAPHMGTAMHAMSEAVYEKSSLESANAKLPECALLNLISVWCVSTREQPLQWHKA